MKYNILAIFAVLLSVYACSNDIPKRTQEQFIRKEYPLSRHEELWKNKTSTCKKLLENSIGYVNYESPYYFFFWEYWHAFQKNGVDKIIIERVDAQDCEQFKPEYREYMHDAIEDLFIDMEAESIKPEYSNMELVVMQLQDAITFATTFDSDERVYYLFDYLYGHCKATTPIPIITGMEYIKKNNDGFPYWRVHFDDGASHNVRVFANDAGGIELERLKLPL